MNNSNWFPSTIQIKDISKTFKNMFASGEDKEYYKGVNQHMMDAM